MWRVLATVGLLICSNTFMTFAWYFHLKKRGAWGLVAAIAISWMIALPEYILQVPANRLGYAGADGGSGGGGGAFTLAQLKIIQEAITLAVFTVFALVVMKEKVRPNDYLAMGLVMAGVVVSMLGRKVTAP